MVQFVSRRFPYSAQPADTQELLEPLNKAHDKVIERASIDDKLLIFKKLVDSTLLRQTHAIKDYRHWVAHQNPDRPRPQKVDPETAFLYLTYFLEEIDRFG